MAVLAAAAFCITLSACSGERSYADQGEAEHFSEEAAVEDDAALEMAADDLSSESFEDVGDTSLCTEDCSGHDAGFEWAKENDITDASECGGNSRSFEEGCEVYAESLQEQADEYSSDE